ncbi:hypothetical protein AB205_0106580 [Aquarana catesbeiana]|uniref:Uncharacterized protein n=1 Tax=Aquarana catesbeiana TaxID=8400 RepID=A0A2G9RWD8_AQUCT|nr:hypothetical protein AB205_0106580 [Aquarana catesbeiana]
MRQNSQMRQIQGVKSSSFNCTLWMKAWTCPRLVGLTVLPSPQWFLQGMVSSTLHQHPPTWTVTHTLLPPPQCILHLLQNKHTSPTLQSHM